MKKDRTFFTIIILGLLCFSCFDDQSSAPSSDYYIKFKANGNQIEYKATIAESVGLSFDQNGPVYMSNILVLDNSTVGTKNAISITTLNETEFITGTTYELQNPISYKGVNISRMTFSWFDNEGNVYNAVVLQQSVPNIEIKETASFRFRTMTENIAEGTFSALIIGPVTNTSRGAEEILITEGDFRLPLIKTY